MTPDQIEQEAIEKYPLPKKPCRREKDTILWLRRKYVEKKSHELIINYTTCKGKISYND